MRPWSRLRLNLMVVQTKALRASVKRLQSHCGQAVGSLRQAKFRPESKHVGLLVSQKKVMEVREFSTHWIGFVQNIQITVFRIMRFGTTEPPVDVQNPMTIGIRTAATCTCTNINSRLNTWPLLLKVNENASQQHQQEFYIGMWVNIHRQPKNMN